MPSRAQVWTTRGVGVPLVALLAMGAHGFIGNSSFLRRGDRAGLFPR